MTPRLALHRTRSLHAPGAALVLTALLAAPRPSAAAPRLAVHVEAGAAHAVGGDKQEQFTWGGLALVAPELQLGAAAGLELAAGGLVLDGSDDAPPAGVAPTDAGFAAFATFGPRLRPLALLTAATDGALRADGLWLAAGLGGAATADGARPALRAALGYDVDGEVVSLGPYVGLVHVVEPDGGSLRPADARVAVVGVHGQLGGSRRVPRPSDTDGDGLDDGDDACVHDPEDRDGFADHDGCPDRDDDADRIADARDRCRTVPEDRDGHDDHDGCPDLDDDRDGLADARDRCPRRPEDRDGRDDHDGCPDLDDDRDGVADAIDRCPIEPETPNGTRDDDGCPDTATLHVLGDRIVLDERVQFPTGSAVIGRSGEAVLRRLTGFLQDHTEYRLVHVAGHADDVGSDAQNLLLSRRRARAVVDALVRLGVSADRLEADAHGEARPRAAGLTEEARRQNRRVELTILERAGEPAQGAAAAPVATQDGGAR